jgi:protein tyrosine kinase modulator
MQTFGVYRALWRHKLLIMTLTAAFVGATWVFTAHETRRYEATSLVRIQERIADPTQAFGALQTGQLLAQTYAKIVETNAVRTRIFALLRDQIPADTAEITIDGSPVPQLDLLRISAQSVDPRRAALVANAAPVALRSFIRNTGMLRDEIETVDRADIPAHPVFPRVTLNLALALVLGLILNGGLALILDYIADRLPGHEELEQALGLPVLASIPVVRFSPVDQAQNTIAPAPSLRILEGPGRSDSSLTRSEPAKAQPSHGG